VFSSTILFYLGAAFAHFVVLPLAFAFFTSITIEGVEATTDIAYYLDFVLTVYFAFGIAFEVPIATFLIIAVGMTTPDKLAQKRPYIIVGAFVIGMFLTPPDIISQTLLALPMWALFELGLLISRMFLKNKKKNPDDEPEPDPDDSAKASTSAAVPPEDPDYEILDMDAEYEPMTDEEMDAELDAIEADDDDDEEDDGDGDGGESPPSEDDRKETKRKK
jgi:sec-independent protein translocase protein TatC